eukprot:GILJ01010869.1.p1 GENE.GILJ01010869.1~~GILJ01010869.1.p1  ORF type:complete len:576 (+),score=55.65 GILJ01010869.1:219-1946(+)
MARTYSPLSLVDTLVDYIATNIRFYSENIPLLPEDIQRKLLILFVEKGLLTDGNLIRIVGSNSRELRMQNCAYIRNSVLLIVSHRCPQLEVLDLSGCKQVNNRVVRAMLQSCPNLKTLRLDGCVRVTDSAFLPRPFQLAAAMTTLEVLSFSRCAQITEESLLCFAKGAPNIRILELSYCKHVSSTTVQTILQAFRHLEALDVSFCENVCDIAFVHCSDGLPSLKRLHLAKCRLTDAALFSLAAGCPNLEILSLRWCLNITDEGLTSVAAACPNLQVLELKNCGHISDVSLSALAQSCPHLSVLDLSWCKRVTDHGIQTLVASCRNLTSLDLSFCDIFSDVPTVNITASSIIHMAQNEPKIQSLSLDGLGSAVSDASLLALSRHCPDLIELGIFAPAALQPTTLSSLGRACERLQTLRIDASMHPNIDDLLSQMEEGFANLLSLSLKASHAGPLTDVGISAVARGCSSLTSLELFSADGVSDVAITDIARHCVHLKTLVLLESILTDVGIEAIASSCKMLEHLELVRCHSVTEASATALVTFAKRLHSVRFKNCENFVLSEDSLRALKDAAVEVLP